MRIDNARQTSRFDLNVIIELQAKRLRTTASTFKMVGKSTGCTSSKVTEFLHVILVALQILANDQIFDPLANHSRIGLEQCVLQTTFICTCRKYSVVQLVKSLEKQCSTYQLVDDL